MDSKKTSIVVKIQTNFEYIATSIPIFIIICLKYFLLHNCSELSAGLGNFFLGLETLATVFQKISSHFGLASPAPPPLLPDSRELRTTEKSRMRDLIPLYCNCM